MKMKVKDLGHDYPFKFNERQRKWRYVNKIHSFEGKIILIFDGCKQRLLEPDFEVIVDEYTVQLIKIENEAVPLGKVN